MRYNLVITRCDFVATIYDLVVRRNDIVLMRYETVSGNYDIAAYVTLHKLHIASVKSLLHSNLLGFKFCCPQDPILDAWCTLIFINHLKINYYETPCSTFMMDYENKIWYEGLSSATYMYVICENVPYLVKGVLWQNEKFMLYCKHWTRVHCKEHKELIFRNVQCTWL